MQLTKGNPTGNDSEREHLLDALSTDLEQNDTALVTGGAGFIGSRLCSVLLEKGFEVYACDNFITGRSGNVLPLLENKRFHFTEMDITRPDFREFYRDATLSHIFHLACPTGVPNISLLGMEMLLTCSAGTLNVLELAREQNASMLLTSSCEVYGQPEVSPQHTSYTGNVNPIGPRCAYEEGKRFSESLLITYVRKFGVDARIVRIFNTYGPGMSPEDTRVIPRFLKSIARRESLRIYGDGEQTRTFCYVDDLVRGLFLALSKGKSGEVYNIGGTEQVSIRGLAELIIELTGHKHGVSFHQHFTDDHRMREPAVDGILELGWEQTVDLHQGLLRMIAALREERVPLEVTRGSTLSTVSV